jgi:pimeloyl-ACP methyl ester carboxylesterase
MDLLGFGRSAKPPDATYSIPEQAKFVKSFLNAKHLDAVALGGVSLSAYKCLGLPPPTDEKSSRRKGGL